MTTSLEALITDELVDKAARSANKVWCDRNARLGLSFIEWDDMVAGSRAETLEELRAALLSVLPDIRKAVLEEAAKACEQYVHHQHPTKPIGVIISSSPPSLAHANAIRALAKEGT